MKAATSSGNTAIAVRGAKSAAFITQKKVPVSLLSLVVRCFSHRQLPYTILSRMPQDKLIDPTSVTSIYRVTDSVGCLMLGIPGK